MKGDFTTRGEKMSLNAFLTVFNIQTSFSMKGEK